MEFRILNRMLEGHDFYEGIRAAIIDKGDAPKWQPGDAGRGRHAAVDALFRAASRGRAAAVSDVGCNERPSSRPRWNCFSRGSSGMIAVYCLMFGVLYWVRLIGNYDGPLWRFDLMPVHWQVVTVDARGLLSVRGDRAVDAGVVGAGDLVHLRGDRGGDVSRLSRTVRPRAADRRRTHVAGALLYATFRAGHSVAAPQARKPGAKWRWQRIKFEVNLLPSFR